MDYVREEMRLSEGGGTGKPDSEEMGDGTCGYNTEPNPSRLCSFL